MREEVDGWSGRKGYRKVLGVVVGKWFRSGCGGGCERGVVTEWLWGWL